jgi:AcrR family transcriptional regulator
MAGRPVPAPRLGHQRDAGALARADVVRRDILAVATEAFAAKGLAGARIDKISERTCTSKRMIYYHFGSKDGLYRAVLEDCYRRIREIEEVLDVGVRPPLEALAHLVRFTFDYQLRNVDFVRLVMVENIHRAAHMRKIPGLPELNSGAVELLDGIVRRGVEEGVMRRGVEPLDLHMSISALCFFNVSNQPTFSAIFNVDMTSAAFVERRRRTVVELILKSVAPNDAVH